MRTVSNQNRSRCISDMFIGFDSRLPPHPRIRGRFQFL